MVARIALLLLLSLSGLATAQVETRALDLQGVNRLEVQTFNGRITLKASQEAPSLTITRRGLTSYGLSRIGETLKVEGQKRITFCSNCQVAFDLSVPAGLELKLQTSNGYIEVRGGVKGLEAQTSNGNILTYGTGTANLTLRTSNGRVEVEDAFGQIRANTSNGQIRLERVTLSEGSSNWARTSNGAISLTNLSTTGGMVITGHTSNGPISVSLPGYEVRLEKRSFEATHQGRGMGRLELHTSNGPITVQGSVWAVR